MTLSELAEMKLRAEIFPTEIFPNTLQNIILDFSEKSGAPIELLSASMITVTGGTIGNSLRFKYGAYEANCILFMCLIAKRGVGKTKPMEMALEPLKNIDTEAWNKYKRALEIAKNTPKQKGEKIELPTLPTTYVPTDTTPEGVIMLHEVNSRGFILYRDELSGFLKGLDQYSQGGEAQKWLQIWNGSSITTVRKSSGITRIEKPHIPILGSIQPELLPKLFEKNRADDGFLDRILFVYPNEVKAQPLRMESVNFEAWERCIQNINILLPLPDGEAVTVVSTQSAWNILEATDTRLTQIVNDGDGTTAGIAAKLRIYNFRFALILNTVHWACGTNQDVTIICDAAATGAGKLCNYFLNQALKVHREASPMQKKIAEAVRLRSEGKTIQEIADILSISVGSVHSYLKKSK